MVLVGFLWFCSNSCRRYNVCCVLISSSDGVISYGSWGYCIGSIRVWYVVCVSVIDDGIGQMGTKVVH
jgi:hypothetical protein